MLAVSLIACTNRDDHKDQTPKTDSTTVTVAPATLKNRISIVEIPASNLEKAISFYEGILGISIEKMDMGDTKMGILPNEQGTVNVVLVKGPDYTPSTSGTTVYLDGGDDLQTVLSKVEANGGKILVPKTPINEEMGFFALFTDVEGNKLGLHSLK